MDRCHESFEALVAERLNSDPQALIYGVTSAPGDAAAAALSDETRAGRPTQLWTAMSFGERLPDRVVRAILVARLANFVDGHAAVRGRLAQAVAAMLDERPVPGSLLSQMAARVRSWRSARCFSG
jgi:histidine ammonia-lyase